MIKLMRFRDILFLGVSLPGEQMLFSEEICSLQLLSYKMYQHFNNSSLCVV
jgi:hypothetical protein